MLLLDDKPSYVTFKLNLPMFVFSGGELSALDIINMCLEQLNACKTYINIIISIPSTTTNINLKTFTISQSQQYSVSQADLFLSRNQSL